jgi:RHS repeat-associated protein
MGNDSRRPRTGRNRCWITGITCGKERDAESGLDYFGARYFSGPQGRFTSPDPLYIEMNRLSDPQQLNLYAYARNNPLKYIDPLGLDITCQGDRCDDYIKALQNDASFKVALKDGRVVTVGDVNKKDLSKTDKALLKAIDDTKHHVVINAVGGGTDANIFFGRTDAPHTGTHTISFDQAGLLDSPKNAGGMTSAGLVGHETLEGYSESLGNAYIDAHNYANRFFGGLDAAPGGTYTMQGGMVTAMTVNMLAHGTNTTEQITIKLVTPIPQADFLKQKGAPYRGYPVNVEVKKP